MGTQKSQRETGGGKQYRHQRNYENLNRFRFEGVGEYNIPELKPEKYEPCEFIGFNYHQSCKEKADRGIHFFLDDYQFMRLWNNMDKYLPVLKQFKYVMAPDFSLYADDPEALQIYNHYRKHWIGAYMQRAGIRVIPTLSWAGQYSFRWCFDGEPKKSVVAVSSVGTQVNSVSKEMFLAGYQEMIARLAPETILFYGKVPEGCIGNIVQLPAFYERFRKMEGR